MMRYASGTVLALLLSAAPAAAACRLDQLAQMPVVQDGNRPYVQGAINGKPMLALADTGADLSLLWRDGAERYGLKPKFVDGVKFVGVGGTRGAFAVTVKELSLGGPPLKDARLFVVPGGRSDRLEEVMVIGQDMLAASDIEFDLANNVIRLLKPTGCEGEPLAYWAKTTYAVADIVSTRRKEDGIEVDILLNGRKVRAILDSGAYTSVVSTSAARNAGVSVTDPGVVRGGVTSGIGPRTLETWVAPFATFQIGDQTIKNAKLRIANLFGDAAETSTGSRLANISTDTPQMLLGADFLRSHRVLVSYSQNKLYFTYNGGKVFQTEGPMLDDDGA